MLLVEQVVLELMVIKVKKERVALMLLEQKEKRVKKERLVLQVAQVAQVQKGNLVLVVQMEIKVKKVR